MQRKIIYWSHSRLRLEKILKQDNRKKQDTCSSIFVVEYGKYILSIRWSSDWSSFDDSLPDLEASSLGCDEAAIGVGAVWYSGVHGVGSNGTVLALGHTDASEATSNRVKDGI